MLCIETGSSIGLNPARIAKEASATLYWPVWPLSGTLSSKLAVTGVPRSGKPQEVIEAFGISASSIVQACNDILKM